MHIDTTILPLGPGKLLINPEYIDPDRLPDILKKWDILDTPEPNPITDRVLNVTSLCGKWLSMNILMIDEKRVIVDPHHTNMMRAMEQWGFEPIPCPFLHYAAFGGAVPLRHARRASPRHAAELFLELVVCKRIGSFLPSWSASAESRRRNRRSNFKVERTRWKLCINTAGQGSVCRAQRQRPNPVAAARASANKTGVIANRRCALKQKLRPFPPERLADDGQGRIARSRPRRFRWQTPGLPSRRRATRGQPWST